MEDAPDEKPSAEEVARSACMGLRAGACLPCVRLLRNNARPNRNIPEYSMPEEGSEQMSREEFSIIYSAQGARNAPNIARVPASCAPYAVGYFFAMPQHRITHATRPVHNIRKVGYYGAAAIWDRIGSETTQKYYHI